MVAVADAVGERGDEIRAYFRGLARTVGDDGVIVSVIRTSRGWAPSSQRNLIFHEIDYRDAFRRG